jgi:hypothetical protein
MVVCLKGHKATNRATEFYLKLLMVSYKTQIAQAVAGF